MTHNITWQKYAPREEQWRRLGQKPAIAWLTGLSGSGKTTISDAVDQTLAAHGRHLFVLDGDNLRHGLCRDLGFTAADRAENVRRAAETARLMAEAGLIVLVALISPSRAERAAARITLGQFSFLEVFVDTPPALCEQRDPKGLYRLARAGRISQFTGVSSPYEVPEAPDLIICTEGVEVGVSAKPLCDKLLNLSVNI